MSKCCIWIAMAIILSDTCFSIAQTQQAVLTEPERLIKKADHLKEGGQAARAIELYSEFIEQYPQQADMVSRARLELIALLFGQNLIDLSTIQRHLGALRNDEGRLTGSLWNYACRLVLHKISAAESDQRMPIWVEGVRDLSVDNISLSIKTLSDLNLCLEMLAGDDHYALAYQILADLLGLNLDSVSQQILQNRLNLCKMQGGFQAESLRDKPQTVPLELRRQMIKATIHSLRGETTQSLGLYSQVIEECSKDQDLFRLAQQKMLSLLFQNETEHTKFIQRYDIDSLVTEGDHLSSDMWNHACRLLLRKVWSAAADKRAAVWEQHFTKLSCDNITISPETLEDLDRLLKFIKKGHLAFAGRILTDLLLLCPDMPSMSEIQQRRIAFFATQESWDQALSAAALNIMLSMGTNEGPRAAVSRYLELMKSAEMTTRQQEYVKSIFCWGPFADNDTAPADPVQSLQKAIASPTDVLLKASARSLLENKPDSLSYRQRGFAQLFTSEFERAISEIHTELSQAPRDIDHIAKSMADISIIFCVADKHFHHCNRFARFLANDLVNDAGARKSDHKLTDPLLSVLVDRELKSRDDNPGDMRLNIACHRTYGQSTKRSRSRWARAVLKRGEQKQDRWAEEALYENDDPWAQVFWVLLINARDGPREAARFIDSIYNRVYQPGVPQQARAFLQGMIGYTQIPAGKRILLLKIAGLLYEEGKFKECLEIFEQADKLVTDPPERQDITMGFIRAISLIRLQKFEEAIQLLRGMENWPALDEQHARAMFLLGWAHLQNNDKTKAKSALRGLIDKYPTTPAAARALEIIKRLEGA